MSTSENQTAADAKPPKEPSIGPACLTISILGLAGFAAFCAFGSWIAFSNQPALAVKAINKQLIPWVESSQLSPNDKQSIVAQLNDLVPQLEAGQIDKRQLTRLRNCLQDNPVLLWGGIQAIEHQAAAAGMTETEIASLKRTNERLLHMATQRQLGRNDIEYAIQLISAVRKDGSTLEVRSNLTADEIRGYVERAENLLNRGKIPNEPYEKTPAEAFAILVDAALKVPDADAPLSP